MANGKRHLLRFIGASAIALVIAVWIFAPHRAATEDRSEFRSIPLANPNLLYQFENLAQRYPEKFKHAFGRPTAEMAEKALRLGRQVFVSEGCWHCHGPATDLNGSMSIQPPTIGPHLNQVGGRYSNDWHAVHLFEPRWTVAGSPMPSYPWFFDGAPDQPNRRALALIAYLQWLGSWQDSYPEYGNYQSIDQLQEAAQEAGLGKAAN